MSKEGIGPLARLAEASQALCRIRLRLNSFKLALQVLDLLLESLKTLGFQFCNQTESLVLLDVRACIGGNEGPETARAQLLSEVLRPWSIGAIRIRIRVAGRTLLRLFQRSKVLKLRLTPQPPPKSPKQTRTPRKAPNPPKQPPSQEPGSGKPPCTFYSGRNGCKKGADCAYEHNWAAFSPARSLRAARIVEGKPTRQPSVVQALKVRIERRSLRPLSLQR